MGTPRIKAAKFRCSWGGAPHRQSAAEQRKAPIGGRRIRGGRLGPRATLASPSKDTDTSATSAVRAPARRGAEAPRRRGAPEPTAGCPLGRLHAEGAPCLRHHFLRDALVSPLQQRTVRCPGRIIGPMNSGIRSSRRSASAPTRPGQFGDLGNWATWGSGILDFPIPGTRVAFELRLIVQVPDCPIARFAWFPPARPSARFAVAEKGPPTGAPPHSHPRSGRRHRSQLLPWMRASPDELHRLHRGRSAPDPHVQCSDELGLPWIGEHGHSVSTVGTSEHDAREPVLWLSTRSSFIASVAQDTRGI